MLKVLYTLFHNESCPNTWRRTFLPCQIKGNHCILEFNFNCYCIIMITVYLNK